jgi:hypothetical protein
MLVVMNIDRYRLLGIFVGKLGTPLVVCASFMCSLAPFSACCVKGASSEKVELLLMLILASKSAF